MGNRRAFLQELVGRGGDDPQDLRVYVVGDRVIGAMRRHAVEDDWRTNVALGGSIEAASDDTPEAVFDLARRTTTTLGLDYAGVDLNEGPTAGTSWR